MIIVALDDLEIASFFYIRKKYCSLWIFRVDFRQIDPVIVIKHRRIHHAAADYEYFFGHGQYFDDVQEFFESVRANAVVVMMAFLAKDDGGAIFQRLAFRKAQ